LFVDASGNVGIATTPTASNALTLVNNGSLAFAGPIGQLNTNSSFSSGSERYITSAAAARYYQINGEHIWQTAAAGTAGNTISFSERLRITSAGLVGIGTSSPQLKLDVATTGTYGVIYQPAVNLRNSSSGGTTTNPTGLGAINWNVVGLYDVANIEAVQVNPSSGTLSDLVFRTNPTNVSTGAGIERLRITSAGNVGIGTTSPAENLTISSNVAATTVVGINAPSGQASKLQFKRSDTNRINIECDASDNLKFYSDASAAERFRCDSSGRLLVGTSTARSNLYNASYAPVVQIETSGALTERTLNLAYNNGAASSGGPVLNFTTSRGSTAGSNTVVASGDELGALNFTGTDGTRPIQGAAISAYVDGTPGNLDMPGRLVFSTTADGASISDGADSYHVNGPSASGWCWHHLQR
jgi:hypothetical protein